MLTHLQYSPRLCIHCAKAATRFQAHTRTTMRAAKHQRATPLPPPPSSLHPPVFIAPNEQESHRLRSSPASKPAPFISDPNSRVVQL